MKNFTLLLFAILCIGTGVGKAQYVILHNFKGADGANPHGSLTVSGNKLYGMTESGGAHVYGCIFSIDTNGNGYKDLLDFNGANSPQGANPYGSLIISGSVLYGMTSSGGSGINHYGCIFAVDTDGTGYKDLYNFDDSTSGAFPYGSLILSGNILYGMTSSGGGGFRNAYADGVVFAININGSDYHVLQILEYGDGSEMPYGSLILSGKALFGMASGNGFGYGDVFRVDTNGMNYKDMWDFGIGAIPDTTGIEPFGSLTLAGNSLYGMTSWGGTQEGNGRIFSIDTDGSNFNHLHNFNGTNDGYPHGSLIFSGGLLYGMTEGNVIGGNIFSINIADTAYTDMFNFNGTKGIHPYGDLTLSGNTLYGMASSGGTNDSGVIFSFKAVGLGVNNLMKPSNAISIYPNPSNGQFTISLSNINSPCNLQVYNMLGEKVYTEIIPQTQSNNTIDLSSQAAGVYLYRVITQTGELVGSGKLIISH